MRVLKWILDRAHGRVGGHETLLGWVPKVGDLDLAGMEISETQVKDATSIDLNEWRAELESQEEFFAQFGKTVPPTLHDQRRLLLSRLSE
jgi:phosphoenolpyruvate carboxykinase (GTP)